MGFLTAIGKCHRCIPGRNETPEMETVFKEGITRGILKMNSFTEKEEEKEGESKLQKSPLVV